MRMRMGSDQTQLLLIVIKIKMRIGPNFLIMSGKSHSGFPAIWQIIRLLPP
jgi:hypothetical protein